MKPTNVSIIIIGNWNPRIFTPTWIKSNLFSVKETDDIQGLVNFEDMDFAFRHDGIVLVPKFNSTEINVEGYDSIKGEQASILVLKLLELLPQTPLKAMGVNIRFEVKRTENNKYVQLINSAKLDFGDFKFNQVKQTLNREKYQVNIMTDLLPEIISINFNFHYTKIEDLSPRFLNEHFEETQKILSNGN